MHFAQTLCRIIHFKWVQHIQCDNDGFERDLWKEDRQ